MDFPMPDIIPEIKLPAAGPLPPLKFTASPPPKRKKVSKPKAKRVTGESSLQPSAPEIVFDPETSDEQPASKRPRVTAVESSFEQPSAQLPQMSSSVSSSMTAYTQSQDTSALAFNEYNQNTLASAPTTTMNTERPPPPSFNYNNITIVVPSPPPAARSEHDDESKRKAYKDAFLASAALLARHSRKPFYYYQESLDGPLEPQDYYNLTPIPIPLASTMVEPDAYNPASRGSATAAASTSGTQNQDKTTKKPAKKVHPNTRDFKAQLKAAFPTREDMFRYIESVKDSGRPPMVPQTMKNAKKGGGDGEGRRE
ncbi:hypothetical protein F5878DRAFT_662036 [Lentinula raphanica]|uniref:Uncharacterized protein n=1 Tax=Lentinula raphanica TaxID=153919 RepID=A0AA38P731_9AGAR|nr:hypothetical protein F5878DRAFT_662036 [Lentinula raphanica]